MTYAPLNGFGGIPVGDILRPPTPRTDEAFFPGQEKINSMADAKLFARELELELASSTKTVTALVEAVNQAINFIEGERGRYKEIGYTLSADVCRDKANELRAIIARLT